MSERPPSYVRIYADQAGETHFEDVHLPVSAQTHPWGTAIEATELIATSGLIFRRVTADASTDTPHNAPRRQFIITLEGAAEVTVSDGESRVFGPGSVVLVEDTAGRGHRTRPLGTVPRVTLFAPLPD
jgi:mannose-6-phosphate isomerase-like protein (cupin superfamily)